MQTDRRSDGRTDRNDHSKQQTPLNNDDNDLKKLGRRRNFYPCTNNTELLFACRVLFALCGEILFALEFEYLQVGLGGEKEKTRYFAI